MKSEDVGPVEAARVLGVSLRTLTRYMEEMPEGDRLPFYRLPKVPGDRKEPPRRILRGDLLAFAARHGIPVQKLSAVVLAGFTPGCELERGLAAALPQHEVVAAETALRAVRELSRLRAELAVASAESLGVQAAEFLRMARADCPDCRLAVVSFDEPGPGGFAEGAEFVSAWSPPEAAVRLLARLVRGGRSDG